VFLFNLIDLIEPGGEAKIRVAIRDNIQSSIPLFFINSTKTPSQTLNIPSVPHQFGIRAEFLEKRVKKYCYVNSNPLVIVHLRLPPKKTLLFREH